MAENKQTGQKPRKIPERRCIGCGQHFPKSVLIRIVRDPEGGISLDFTGKKAGRGAYLCRNVTCLRHAMKSHRAEQNLECRIPDEVYRALEEELLGT